MVYDGHDEEKRQPHQQVLEGDGKAKSYDTDGHRPVKPYHGQGKGKGQSLPADEAVGNHHRQSLGRHSSQGRSGGALVEEGHQQEVAEGIEYRCNGHGDKGRLGVPETPENTADEVVADNGHHTAAADADIGHRLFKGFRGSIHPSCEGGSKDREAQGEEKPQQEAEADAVSRNLPALGSPAGSYILAHEDGDTHGEAGGEHGKGLEHLGPRGHSRHIGGTGEMAYDKKIHRPIKGLEEQGPNRKRGPAMGPDVKLWDRAMDVPFF